MSNDSSVEINKNYLDSQNNSEISNNQTDSLVENENERYLKSKIECISQTG